MNIPSIQINQQYARIGIDADLGKYSIRQPRPSLELEQQQAKLKITSPAGELSIDQSKAWDALGRGGALRTMDRIYSQASSVAMQGIARIAQRGDRMAMIHIPNDAIAELAQQESFRFHEFDFAGEAAYDNVDIRYTARKPIIEVMEGKANVRATVNSPEIEYTRGKLDIYMLQYGKVTIIPPQLDIFV